MPLIGTLRDLSLPNLVQLQCSEQHHAQVVLTRGAHKGALVFAEGELIFARADDLTGENAVYELLMWEDGDFRVDTEAHTVERNVTTPWSALLMEGLRRADEARAKRNTAFEAALRRAREQHRIHEALIVSPSGTVKADATSGDLARRAALITFIIQRALNIGATIKGGSYDRFLCTWQNQRVWIERLEDDYLACWLEGRTTPESLRDLTQSLQAIASSESR